MNKGLNQLRFPFLETPLQLRLSLDVLFPKAGHLLEVLADGGFLKLSFNLFQPVFQLHYDLFHVDYGRHRVPAFRA